MSVHIVRLGGPRAPDEGLRIGTVRRPPRGVKREDYASGDWFDVWLPLLAPAAADVALALTVTSTADWERFAKRYRAAMAKPDASRVLDTLAALSRQTNFAVGCYCADESRCHRRLLRELFLVRGAPVI